MSTATRMAPRCGTAAWTTRTSLVRTVLALAKTQNATERSGAMTRARLSNTKLRRRPRRRIRFETRHRVAGRRSRHDRDFLRAAADASIELYHNKALRRSLRSGGVFSFGNCPGGRPYDLNLATDFSGRRTQFSIQESDESRRTGRAIEGRPDSAD